MFGEYSGKRRTEKRIAAGIIPVNEKVTPETTSGETGK
jgi:hypothetical protein